MNDAMKLKKLIPTEVNPEYVFKDWKSLENEIIVCHEGLKKMTAVFAFEIGKRLCVAKEKLGHGRFLPWLEEKFPFSERTARSYMALYSYFKSAKFADLSTKNLNAAMIEAGVIKPKTQLPALEDTRAQEYEQMRKLSEEITNNNRELIKEIYEYGQNISKLQAIAPLEKIKICIPEMSDFSLEEAAEYLRIYTEIENNADKMALLDDDYIETLLLPVIEMFITRLSTKYAEKQLSNNTSQV
ncbi:DUF3102 domain-containing protein [Brucepastera parasyntrophica]|uniref:DUF3102 domain-containing protein n=1 Tax=Brucepastera parasyntrophica TaxID=2880008 RepID=UPI00210DA83C|nr:DUF3102 domain-containing protein [Brucepastera parasyntrophica]ULQ60812.1 DUF3102 domain-containing protein [Brucepastera parasyntrophica]